MTKTEQSGSVVSAPAARENDQQTPRLASTCTRHDATALHASDDYIRFTHHRFTLNTAASHA